MAVGQTPRDDKELIEGTWVVESVVENGKEVPATELKEVTVTFKGGKVGWVGPGFGVTWTFRLDASAKPKV